MADNTYPWWVHLHSERKLRQKCPWWISTMNTKSLKFIWWNVRLKETASSFVCLFLVVVGKKGILSKGGTAIVIDYFLQELNRTAKKEYEKIATYETARIEFSPTLLQLYFPALLVVRCVPMTEIWSMECELKLLPFLSHRNISCFLPILLPHSI